MIAEDDLHAHAFARSAGAHHGADAELVVADLLALAVAGTLLLAEVLVGGGGFRDVIGRVAVEAAAPHGRPEGAGRGGGTGDLEELPVDFAEETGAARLLVHAVAA